MTIESNLNPEEVERYFQVLEAVRTQESFLRSPMPSQDDIIGAVLYAQDVASELKAVAGGFERLERISDFLCVQGKIPGKMTAAQLKEATDNVQQYGGRKIPNKLEQESARRLLYAYPQLLPHVRELERRKLYRELEEALGEI